MIIFVISFPLMVIISPVGFFFFLAAPSIFLQSILAAYIERQKMLDMLDAQVESKSFQEQLKEWAQRTQNLEGEIVRTPASEKWNEPSFKQDVRKLGGWLKSWLNRIRQKPSNKSDTYSNRETKIDDDE